MTWLPSELPSGTVTFLFTDIEGSTRLLQLVGDDYPALLEEHARLVREAVESCGGVEVSTEGDAFFCVFETAPQGVEASVRTQRALVSHSWPEGAAVRVRMGLHSGRGILGGDNYVGLDVHRAARVASAGHGCQVLLSEATRALAEHQLPEGVALRDLGRHRLKDLAHPEHLYQLVIPELPADFPPVRSLEATPNNLPVQLTSFVGREREVAEALGLLESARLLTLIGPGGTGKTRLSLQVAAEAAERFPDGVWFVPLAPIRDPELLASALVTTLQLPIAGERPWERVVEYLRDKTLLLVLDNFEQIVQAGSSVAELLRAAPRLKVMVTSRAPLHLSGEQEYPVPPLGIPDPGHLPPPEALAHFEAVSLFAERAVAARPDFALTPEIAPLVAEITARLDGLPLAIELAAARIKLLPPRAMLERLSDRLGLLAGGSRDLPTRQQTLRDAIAWSYDLLDEPARRLLERLAVFSAGCALEQAEAVCGQGLGAEVLEGLGMLVDQSLLRQEEVEGEPRFSMLETIRDFAQERLAGGGEEEEIRRRHAEAYLELAERAEPHLLSREQKGWLDRLEREHDNFRAALDWARAHGQADLGQRMASALWRFWQIRGHLHEAQDRLQALLALPGVPAIRAKALEAAGGIAYWQGDMDRARRSYQESLELFHRLGDRSGEANALYNLSFPYAMGEHDYARARELRDEGAAIYHELGDRAGIAKVLWGQGNLEFWFGDRTAALPIMEQALAIFRELDDPFGMGWALYMLGTASLDAEDREAARTYLSESLRMFAEVKDVSAVVIHLGTFAQLALSGGDEERAARLFKALAGLQKASGSGLWERTAQLVPVLRNVSDRLRERVETLLAEEPPLAFEEAIDLALGEGEVTTSTTPAEAPEGGGS